MIGDLFLDKLYYQRVRSQKIEGELNIISNRTSESPMIEAKKIIHPVKLVYTILLAIFFLAPAASAEEHYIRNGFWGGIDTGAGFLQQSFNEEDDDDIYFFLGFQGGYTINPHFLIGLELSGWLLEASDLEDPNKGKGISQVFLITRLYPSKGSGLFVKAGGGYVSNWSNRSDEPRRKEGWGLTVGGGYDFLVYEAIALSPFATFSYGETGNWDYHAITFGLGFTIP